jgi:uncharacterized protein YjbK
MENIELEFETRAMLSLSQYSNILYTLLEIERIPFKKLFLENEYYDTSSLSILKSKNMLRVRILDSSFDLTLKVARSTLLGDKEFHQTLTKDEYLNLKNNNIFPNGKIKDILINEGINIFDIKYKTTLFCIRYEFYSDDTTICLDKNKYDNITDFNIEVESSSYQKSLNKNLELSKKFSYELKEDYKTKYMRALLRY